MFMFTRGGVTNSWGCRTVAQTSMTAVPHAWRIMWLAAYKAAGHNYGPLDVTALAAAYPK